MAFVAIKMGYSKPEPHFAAPTAIKDRARKGESVIRD
jgi:hypothetical protein